MNIGIIGLGYWGPNIVRNAVMNKDIDKVVCCDTDKKQLEKMQSTFASVKTTVDINDIVKDTDIDAVIVVTTALLLSDNRPP